MKTLTETLKKSLDAVGSELTQVKAQRRQTAKAIDSIKTIRKALADEIRGLKAYARTLPNGLPKDMFDLLEWKRDQYRELSAQQPMVKWSLRQLNQIIRDMTPEVRDLDSHWEAAKAVDEANKLIAEGV